MCENLQDDYLLNGSSDLSDFELLEKALSLAVAKNNSKEIADNLMNEFNNLKSVSVASPKRLMQIDGVNEQVATYLSLMRDILARIELRKNQSVDVLADVNSAIEYAKNMLLFQDVERVVLITLDEDCQSSNPSKWSRTHDEWPVQVGRHCPHSPYCGKPTPSASHTCHLWNYDGTLEALF